MAEMVFVISILKFTSQPLLWLVLPRRTHVEQVETVVTVDNRGNATVKYDGLGITYLARRYGFGKNTKSCRQWLESIGIHDNQWLSEPFLIKSRKLPREILPFLDQQYGTKQGVRQRLIGE